MKKTIVLLILIFSYTLTHSQHLFEGYVTNKDSVGIPFANISVKNKPVGTCSNENGYFNFVVDSAYTNDSIVISCMGYNDLVFNYQEINSTDSLFMLAKANYKIQATIIMNNAPTKEKILKRVKRNYRDNYPTSSYLGKAFFQDIVYNDAIEAKQDVARITEAAITIQEFGVHALREPKFRVDEMRNSHNFVKTNKKMEWLIKLAFGGMQNPITEMYKMYDLTRKREFKSLTEECTTHLERIEFLDTNSVYVMKFIPKEKLSGWIYDYKIYVNTSDYAIVKVDFNKRLTKGFQKMLKKKHQYHTRKLKLYRKIQGKYYPYLIEFIAPMRDQGYKFRSEEQYYRHSFIMFNEIFTKRRNFKRVKWSEKIDENEILYNKEFTYNKNFWKDFNILYTQEEVTKARKILNREKPIKQQFIENSK